MTSEPDPASTSDRPAQPPSHDPQATAPPPQNPGGDTQPESPATRAARIAIGSQRPGSRIIRSGTPASALRPVPLAPQRSAEAPSSGASAQVAASPPAVPAPAAPARVAPHIEPPSIAPHSASPEAEAPAWPVLGGSAAEEEQVHAGAAPHETVHVPDHQPGGAAVSASLGGGAATDAPRRDDGGRGRKKHKDRGADFDMLPPVAKTPVPNLRAELSPDLQAELDEALGGMSIEDALEPEAALAAAQAPGAELEQDSRHKARVVSIHRDDVFVELGGRNQGVLSLRTFQEPPEVNSVIDVNVHRFNPEEGLYQLSLPHVAFHAANWGDIVEGAMVEARITGHNKGGLECEVNNIRGFIPAGQIDVYRVEDLSQFVGQKLPCIVTEARAERSNLVLSARAVIERQKAAAKENLLKELAAGQEREGIVRSLQDFGAFVDLGGVDGLIHISQLAWHRVKHPSEVLSLGQKVKVLVRKIDPDTHKISLTLRDLAESPWAGVAAKYPVTSVITGTVTKLMEFGAFVQLEPGIEGLVHISELSHQRVWRASDIVKEGDTVEAKVLSVDTENQRISLSMKALAARPGPVKKVEEPEEEVAPAPIVTKRKGPLKGGIGKASGGEQFGLKW